MHFIFSSILSLLFCYQTQVLARVFPPTPYSFGLTRRQSQSTACNVTCTFFEFVDNNCNTPHCGCNVTYIEAQGNCYACNASTPEDQALVQFLLDAEMDQCHREGIPVSFSLDLPPPAEALVQMYNHQSADLRRNQAVFLSLQIIGGHIGLPVVLTFAVFSHRVRRDPTFLNFCITWIFSSIAFSILLYHGTTDNTVANTLGEVEPNICLAQAALTEGAQVMTACSTMSLIIRLWLGLRAVIHGDKYCPKKSTANWINVALLIIPYLFFVTFALASIFVGTGQIDVQGTTLQRVIPTNFYCTVVAPNAFIRVVYGVTLAFLLITMGLDAHIIGILYMHWRAFRNTNSRSAVSRSLLIRVVFFSIYRIVVAVADGTVLRVPPTVGSEGQGAFLAVTFGLPIWVDMLQAAIPLIATIVLGITSEMIASIFMCRRRDYTIEVLDSGFDAEADVECAEGLGKGKGTSQ